MRLQLLVCLGCAHVNALLDEPAEVIMFTRNDDIGLLLFPPSSFADALDDTENSSSSLDFGSGML